MTTVPPPYNRLDFMLGSTVKFADDSAVVDVVRSDGDPDTVIATGTVNGPVVEDREYLYVPVFASRDGGREPTTIYVNTANVLEVVLPKASRERAVPCGSCGRDTFNADRICDNCASG